MSAQVVCISPSESMDVVRFLRSFRGYDGYVISDLQRIQFEPPHVHMFGMWGDGGLTSTLLVFPDKAVLFSTQARGLEPYLEVLEERCVTKLVGISSAIKALLPSLNVKQHTVSVVRSLSSEPRVGALSDDADQRVRRLTTVEDFRKLHDLFASVDEYRSVIHPDQTAFVETELDRFQNDSVRTYGLTENDQWLATAAYLNQPGEAAIVIGVATHPGHRGRGYAKRVMVHLCRDVVKQGKTAYVFFTNPEAGVLYERLGFTDGGDWSVVQLDA